MPKTTFTHKENTHEINSLSLRTLVNCLNCIHEYERYEIILAPKNFSLLLDKEHIFMNTPYTEIISAYNFLIKELSEYLKDGGMLG